MKQFKRFISLLLSTAMLLAFAPEVSAAANATVSNFNELKTAVDNACSYITLSDDITATETLILKASTRIEGQGHSITGNGTFCLIYADTGYGLVLQNLTMRGGNAAGGGYVDTNPSGGAVSSKSLIIAENCKFTDNNAPGDGGALYAWGAITLTDCEFSNCSAMQRGGAVLAAGALSVTGCTFTNCSAAWFGGALMEYSNGVEVTSSTFTDCICTANGCKGGAIYSDTGNVTLLYDIFSGCQAQTATGKGGAVYTVSGSVNLQDSTIHDCLASSGAAMFSESGDITAYHVTEYLNQSQDAGDNFIAAAGKRNVLYSVYTETALRTYVAKGEKELYLDADITLTGTLYLTSDLKLSAPEKCISITGNDTFTLIFGDSDYSLAAENILFSHGNAAGGGYVDGAASGGAICLKNGSFEAENCSFTDNFAPGKSGAVYSWKNITLTGCTFSNNSCGQSGGCIYAGGSVTANDCTFTDNTAAWYGGAIKTVAANVEVTDCVFTHNTVTGNGACGGAIHTNGGSSSAIGCTFTGNTASSNGGAIWTGAGTAYAENCLFSENASLNKAGSCVATNTGNITYVNNILTNNLSAGKTGDEYYSESGQIINNSDEISLHSSSLVVAEKIGVRFYFSIPDIFFDDTDVYANVTIPDEEDSYNLQVSLSDMQPETIDDKTYYYLTAYVTAIDMSRPVEVTFCKGQSALTDTFKLSVKDYAGKVVTGNGYDKELVSFCKALLNYGSYAQIYFNKYLSGIPNDVMKKEDKDVSKVTAADLMPFAAKTEGSVPGISFSGNMMSLESGAAITLLFKLDEEAGLNDYTFKVKHGLAKLKRSGNYYKYEYDLIPSSDFGKYIPFTVTKDSESMTICISALSYAYQVLSYTESGLDPKLVDLMKAMYLYYVQSREYIKMPLIPKENIEPEKSLKAFRMFPYYWLTDDAWEATYAGLLEDKNTIDEVVLFCDMMHSPYMSDANLTLYTSTIAKRTEQLKAAGFKVGYNMLQTVGHGDYAVDWLDTPVYSTKVGYNGAVSAQMPCMRDAAFLSFIAKKYTAYASCAPEFIWVDDDFRTNDTTVPFGCFCSHCISDFNKKFGYSYTRESLVDILSKDTGASSQVRQRWCEFTAESYNNVIKVIANAVSEVSPDIEMRLMTVHLPASASTLSNYAEMAENLGAKAIRAGGGLHNESDPVELLTKIYGVSHQIAQLADIEGRMYECEDFPQTYYKSGYFHILEGTASLLAGCNGIAFASIAPDQGNDYIMDSIAAYSPVWDEIVAIGDSYRLYGSTALYKENYAVNAAPANFFSQVGFSEHLNEMTPFTDGFLSYTPYEENANITFISGDMIKSMTDDEITQVFSKGVFIDGAAAYNLSARGFGYLIGTSGVSYISSQLQERYTDSKLNGSAAGTIRYTYSAGCYNFVLKNGAQALGIAESVTGVTLGTTTYVYENNLGGRVCVCGFQTWSYGGTWQKMEQYDNIFDWLAKGRIYAKVENAEHIALLYKQPDDRSEFMLMAINAFLDETPDGARVRLEGTYDDTIYCYDQYGKLTKLDPSAISHEGGFTTVRLPHIPAWGFVVLYTAVD